MYGGSILLIAACALPLLAAPIPGHEVISPIQVVERRTDYSLNNIRDSIIKRVLLLESSPIETRTEIVVEDKREEALGELVDEKEELEKRGRIGKGSSSGKRDEDELEKRGRIGKGSSSGKRDEDELEKRGRIGKGSSSGKRDRFGAGSGSGRSSLIRRTLDVVFG